MTTDTAGDDIKERQPPRRSSGRPRPDGVQAACWVREAAAGPGGTRLVKQWHRPTLHRCPLDQVAWLSPPLLENSRVSQARILFVSHEASRTGAPILLLNLLRWIKQHTSWQVDVLLNYGGELTGEFAKLGTTSRLPPWNARLRLSAVRDRLARRHMLSWLRSTEWSLVYSNTATNGEALNIVGGRQPIISHIHELATTIRLYG